MPITGKAIIAIILFTFVTALSVLFALHAKYRRLQSRLARRKGEDEQSGFLARVKKDFQVVYRQNGAGTNTPAIIDNAAAAELKNALMGERFLNNSVSIFVTLGLLGTFLGLSLSVGSLSELIGVSGSGEWLSVLDSVGGGLLSALSGMGVAFYTSLFGVSCAVVLTVLRTIFSPDAQRERLRSMIELWLDNEVALQTVTEAASDDREMVLRLQSELRAHAEAVKSALTDCTFEMSEALSNTTAALGAALAGSRQQLDGFANTVGRFNENVRDFSEFNHHLRNNIERMDVNFVKLTEAMREAARFYEGGGNA
jgi:hypothetical protein